MFRLIKQSAPHDQSHVRRCVDCPQKTGKCVMGRSLPLVAGSMLSMPAVVLFASLGSVHQAAACTSEYRVQAGDTLESIANDHYGDASAWQLILTTNPTIGADEVTVPGTILFVPCSDAETADQVASHKGAVDPVLALRPNTATAPFVGENLQNGGLITEIIQAAMALNENAGPLPIEWSDDQGNSSDDIATNHLTFPHFPINCSAEPEHLLCTEYTLSDPVLDLPMLVFGPKDAEFDWRDERQLQGKRLCRPEAYPIADLDRDGRRWISENKIELTRASNAADCFTALVNGDVDAVSVDVFAGSQVLQDLDLYFDVVPFEAPLSVTTMHVAGLANDPKSIAYLQDFNSALAQLRAQPSYQLIVSRQLDALLPPPTEASVRATEPAASEETAPFVDTASIDTTVRNLISDREPDREINRFDFLTEYMSPDARPHFPPLSDAPIEANVDVAEVLPPADTGLDTPNVSLAVMENRRAETLSEPLQPTAPSADLGLNRSVNAFAEPVMIFDDTPIVVSDTVSGLTDVSIPPGGDSIAAIEPPVPGVEPSASATSEAARLATPRSEAVPSRGENPAQPTVLTVDLGPAPTLEMPSASVVEAPAQTTTAISAPPNAVFAEAPSPIVQEPDRKPITAAQPITLVTSLVPSVRPNRQFPATTVQPIQVALQEPEVVPSPTRRTQIFGSERTRPASERPRRTNVQPSSRRNRSGIIVVGVFDLGRETWGLLRLPSGEIREIRPGETLAGVSIENIDGVTMRVRSGGSRRTLRTGDVID